MISTSNLMNVAKKYFKSYNDNDFKGIELEEKKYYQDVMSLFIGIQEF